MTADAKDAWKQIAKNSRATSEAETDRGHTAYFLGCRANGGEAELAFRQARAIAIELRKEDGLDAEYHCFPKKPTGILPGSIRHAICQITGDHVAIHADVLLGMEAELADARHAMHFAQYLLAAWMAGDTTIVAYLEQNREGMANVAAGRSWSYNGDKK
jgi:hypothetical protein